MNHLIFSLLQNKRTFVGIDVAGDECNYSSKPFAPLFQMAKRNGMHVTVHAGEVCVINNLYKGNNRVTF